MSVQLHTTFSYSWSSFSMLRFLVIRLWCAATRSSCIEINWAQYKKLRSNFNLHYNTILKGHIISPWVEHTLGAKLPPALSCWGVRHQAPPHLMLPLASKDVLHFSTPEKNQLLRCGISISTYLIVLKFIEVLTAEVSPLSWGQTSKNSFWPRRSDVPPTLNCFCPSAQSKL